MKKGIRIVFMGTPDFAVASLNAIIAANIEVAGVVTAPDKPAGRGLQMHEPAVKVAAKKHGITSILQPEKLKDPVFLANLESLEADLFVVVAFRMLPEIVWQMPEMGTINLHASLLPQYRGAAPINWAIINGEKESGVSTFFIEKEIDTGHVLFQEKVSIGIEETAGDLHDKLMNVGAGLLVQTIKMIESEDIKPIPQDSMPKFSELKPAPKIFKENCCIDWSLPGEKIYNLIRGLSPYPTAFTEIKNEQEETIQIKIFEAGFEQQQHSIKTGSVEFINHKQMRIACNDGFIEIKSLQQAGKKRMDIGSFLRGFSGRDQNFSVV